MKELLQILRLAPEIRALVAEIGRLLGLGDSQTALETLKAYQLGQAAGKAAWKASRAAKGTEP